MRVSVTEKVFLRVLLGARAAQAVGANHVLLPVQLLRLSRKTDTPQLTEQLASVLRWGAGGGSRLRSGGSYLRAWCPVGGGKVEPSEAQGMKERLHTYSSAFCVCPHFCPTWFLLWLHWFHLDVSERAQVPS